MIFLKNKTKPKGIIIETEIRFLENLKASF